MRRGDVNRINFRIIQHQFVCGIGAWDAVCSGESFCLHPGTACNRDKFTVRDKPKILRKLMCDPPGADDSPTHPVITTVYVHLTYHDFGAQVGCRIGT